MRPILFADFRDDPVAHPLTPSGRIELYSETIARFALPDCGPHPAWIEPSEWLGSERTRGFPLHLLTVQPADRLHSQLDFAPLPQGNKVAGECIALNPLDASARDCKDGDLARVFNDRGACLADVRVDASVKPGVAVMATGAWFDPNFEQDGAPERAGTANVLARYVGTSLLTQGPNAMSCLVEVERFKLG